MVALSSIASRVVFISLLGTTLNIHVEASERIDPCKLRGERRPQRATSFNSDTHRLFADLKQKKTPRRLRKARTGYVDVLKEEVLAEFIEHERAIKTPNPLNGGGVRTWNRNCALVAIGGALRKTSTEVLSLLPQCSVPSSYQPVTAFNPRGCFLSGDLQRENMNALLCQQWGDKNVVWVTDLSSEQATLEMMHTFEGGTRFVVDLDSHFVTGVLYKGKVITIDYQTNVLESVPPMYALEELNPMHHATYSETIYSPPCSARTISSSGAEEVIECIPPEALKQEEVFSRSISEVDSGTAPSSPSSIPQLKVDEPTEPAWPHQNPLSVDSLECLAPRPTCSQRSDSGGDSDTRESVVTLGFWALLPPEVDK